jgi:GAF domain-containing protein
MTDPGDLRAAVAAGALGARATHAALLRSIVDVARAIFGARAASIMIHDPDAGELIFAAATGEGSNELLGRRIPAGSGLAGWVLNSRQPLVVENVADDPRFARDVAASTGFVPKGIMVVPLLIEDRVLGVLSVLDRPEQAKFTLPEMELLGRFSVQAALALELTERARSVREVLDQGPDELSELAQLAAALADVDDERRDSAHALVRALRDLLR